MVKEHPPDLSYEELEPMLMEILEKGGVFWGKFDCAKCGARQTFDEPNRLFTHGKCEECGHVTILNKWGLLTLEVL